MESLIFKNKQVKYRKEDFGGLVLIDNLLYILSEDEYNLISKIDKKRYAKESSLSKKELGTLKKLSHNQILLKIDSKKAEQILKTKRI